MSNISTPEADTQTRRHIAMGIVIGGSIAVAVLGLAIVIAPAVRGDAAQFQTTAQLVLTSILPLVGTWIGTVLAFYFAKENFESASRVTKDLLGIDEKLRSIPAKDAMIPADKVDAFKLAAQAVIPAHGANAERKVSVPATADAILVDDALDFLAARKRNRLPVLDANGAAIYVIHVSALDRFRSRQLRLPPTTPPADPAKWTLGDLRVKDPELFKGILAWAAIPEAATLADAKHAMETTPNCLDVFVTKTGKTDGAIVGWLTNIEIGQRSTA